MTPPLGSREACPRLGLRVGSAGPEDKAEPGQKAERMSEHWVGFDLGGTKMLAQLFDGDFKVLAQRRRKTRGTAGAEVGLRRIIENIEKVLAEAGVARQQLSGIGIGVPGPVDWETGKVLVAVNLGWKDTPVGTVLSKHFGCPVRILNDVDAGVYGEYRFGAARSARCAVGLFPGTGIGGGCVYEGNILRGRNISCMEVGHMRISSSGRTAGLEMSGTLESEASRLTIAAECAKLAFRGQAPKLLELAGTDLSKIRSGTLAQAIEAGDRAVERVVRTAAQQIGYACVNLIHLICPDRIVLGGGLVEAMPKLIVDEVTKVARQNVLSCYADGFEVKVAKLGDDAGAIGAAAWVAHQVQAKAN